MTRVLPKYWRVTNLLDMNTHQKSDKMADNEDGQNHIEKHNFQQKTDHSIKQIPLSFLSGPLPLGGSAVDPPT